jgi:glucosamine--fructose-6-phosphate aminotransferase (isomerizing)
MTKSVNVMTAALITTVVQDVQAQPADTSNSGIFGYINYLVEKDRKYILDTLVNG